MVFKAEKAEIKGFWVLLCPLKALKVVGSANSAIKAASPRPKPVPV